MEKKREVKSKKGKKMENIVEIEIESKLKKWEKKP